MAPNPDLTTSMEQPQMVAFKALTNLYDSWEQAGGPSPSTDDEARTVAQALGAPNPVTDERTLNDLWEMDMQGADLWDIACAHVAALEALHVCSFCGTARMAHPDSMDQYGEPVCVICYNTSHKADA